MVKVLQKINIRRGAAIFIKYLKPFRNELGVILVFSFIAAGANALTPLFAGRIFDALIKAGTVTIPRLGPVPKALAFIVLWFMVRALGDFSEWQKSFRQEHVSALVEANYLVHAFSQIIQFPLSFHKRYRVGEIINRVQRGASHLETISQRVLIDLLPDFLSIILAFGIVFFIQPKLAIVLLIAIAIYILLLVRTAPGLSQLSYKMHKAYSTAYGYSSDLLMNAHAVKQATAETHEKRQLYRHFQLNAARLWTQYMRIWQQLSFFQRAIATFTQLGIFVYSYYLVRAGALTPGGLVAFNGYTAMAFGPFAILARNWDTVQNGFAAIDRAEKIIELSPEAYVPEQAVIPNEIHGSVEFRNVTFTYGRKGKGVLTDINFSLPAGSSVALVGASGVGKSTLIDLISGYYRPAKGKVFVDGHDVGRLDLQFLRSQIAVVPQELLLFNDTIKQNIRYGSFEATDDEVVEAAKRAHADDFISAFPRKYTQLVGERGIKLSVGQKQRIAIARAILRNPKILILDEPTSALDAKSESLIQRSLQELMVGRTTFIIAHRLSTVRKANVILVLEKGTIVERGMHDELIRIPNGVYRKLYELQIGLK